MLARFLTAAVLVFSIGCGKQSTARSPSTAAPQLESTAASDKNQIAAILSELTQAVRKFSVEQRRVPKTLEEVAARGYLIRVPQAPPGRRFAIDKNLQVYLANQ